MERFTKGYGTICKFNSLVITLSFVERCNKIQQIVLGDDEKYLVVTPPQAYEIKAHGYEIFE
jgi:hypothetical protein